MKFKLLLVLLFHLFVFAQKRYDQFKTNDETINSYYHLVDSISNEINLRNNFDKIKFSYEYVDKIDDYKNVITTNYWTKEIYVNFVFKDDNLSYLTPNNFDDFRRRFYQQKKLNVLVNLDDKLFKNHFLKLDSLGRNLSYFKNEEYVKTVLFFKEQNRFLIFEYYFDNEKLIKIKVCELKSDFQWDMINYTEFYYKDTIIVFRKFYQSVMDGQFSLDVHFDENELLDKASEIMKNIENN